MTEGVLVGIGYEFKYVMAPFVTSTIPIMISYRNASDALAAMN